MATSKRMFIYGTGLPNVTLAPSSSISVQITILSNTFPSSGLSDLLPLDYMNEEETASLIPTAREFTQANLNVFNDKRGDKIEKLIDMTKIERNNTLKEISNKKYDTDSLLDKSIEDLKNTEICIPKKKIIGDTRTEKIVNYGIQKVADSINARANYMDEDIY